MLFALCLGASSAASAAPAEPGVYLQRIKPLLAEKCYRCHGAGKQKGGLRLDTAGFIRQGGKQGPAIVPGQAAGSLLIRKVQAREVDKRMPREGTPLSAEQIDFLAHWINQGAAAPAQEKAQEDPRKHWAFQRPKRPSVPALRHPESGAPGEARGGRNPIDAFLARRHAEARLQPRPQADKATLLRRVYLDLTGIPPTRGELHAFLADDSPTAYQQVVDRLLESPQYGERWARHWMDIWRYSDWYGRRSQNDVRNSAPHIWRWRDWIVRSLNNDKGYDRMILEMLAADELAPENDRQIVATGFIVRNWFSLNYDQWMKDLVEHTGKAFLGLTLNCAHCHDHKYDPISQQEYFAFRAFFEPLEFRHDRVPGGGPLPKYERYIPGSGSSLRPTKAGLARIFDHDLDARTWMYEGGDARNRMKDQPPVEPAAPAVVGGDRLPIEPLELPPVGWYPGLKPFAQQEELEKCRAAVRSAQQALRKLPGDSEDSPARRLARARLATAKAELEFARARTSADNARYRQQAGNAAALALAAAKAERQAAACSANEAVLKHEQAVREAERKAARAKDDKSKEKADATLKKAKQRLTKARKSLAQKEAALGSDSPEYTPLGPRYPQQSTGRRAALARWIASPDNPLTARVAVNHIWARHFHQPMVEPVFDFGRSGGEPAFPQLLDWLAVEFMEAGWRMKHLHRLIVTSNAYRRDSRSGGPDPPNLAVDRDNRLLWRFPSHRMEAEVVRDSLLHAARQMDRTMGGPVLANSQADTSRRRSLYFATFPEQGGTGEFVALFDAPDPGDCYRRTESTVPQQALALTNSRLSLNQSRLLAQALWKQLAGSAPATGQEAKEADFINAAFEQILSRGPSPQEFALCLEFLANQRNTYRQADLEALQSKTPRQTVAASTDPAMRARESLVQALFNHNDFVTVH